MPFRRYQRHFERRNLLRNTEMRGNIAGDPAIVPGDNGTLPLDFLTAEDPVLATNNVDYTNWGVTNEGGLRRLDLAFTTAAATAGGNVAIYLSDFVNPMMTHIRRGDFYVFTLYVRAVALPGALPTIALQINEYSDSGQYQAMSGQTVITPTLGSLLAQRWAVSGRVGAALTTRIRPVLGIYYNTAQAFDFRIGIAAPQLERASRASVLQHRFI